jgi:hypothetical protein
MIPVGYFDLNSLKKLRARELERRFIKGRWYLLRRE